jgi:hypothetical protein
MQQQKVCDEFSPKSPSMGTQVREGLHTLYITKRDLLLCSMQLQTVNHMTCSRAFPLTQVVPEMKTFHRTSFITVVTFDA